MTGWVAGRRQVLWAGATIAGATLLGACGEDDPATVPRTGTQRTRAPEVPIDVVLANTALSLELLVMHTYDVAARSGLLDGPTSSTAGLFRSHHAEHGDVLAAIVAGRGETPVTAPNAVARSALVDPALAGAATAGDLVQIMADLERVIAQVYVFAAARLTTPALRSTVMTIGGVEARHRAVLDTLVSADTGDGSAIPGAFARDESPLPDGAIISGR